jgi:hypothetical protein
VAHVSFEDAAEVDSDRAADLVALDDGLEALARIDARKVQVVEMRFFGGLSVEEGVAERAEAFAVTRSCMGRLRRTRWITLRSSCIEQD